MGAITRRLLYVTPFSLLPRVEGHRKRMAMTFDAIKEAGFEVHVLFISREYEWSELFNPRRYHELFALADLTFFCHAGTPGPPIGDVYTLDEWWPPHCDEYCRWVFANNGYEIVFCNYIFMSRVFNLVDRSTIKIMDTHDVFTDRKKMLLENSLKPEFFYTTRADEREGLERADVALAIKQQEADYFQSISDIRIITLPYYESTPADRTAPDGRRPGKTRFGFFGSSNSINLRNILEFLDFLRTREPEGGFPFEFWLYGSLCKRLPPSLPGFAQLGGYVDAVEEFYRSVDCVVNPQHFSTGLKIKVAEALAYKAPLICHRHSFEGFGAPVHPAQDCVSFEAVLSAMLRAADDPGFLEEVRQASAATQQTLAAECSRQMAKVLSVSKSRGRWLWVFVDAGAFDTSRLYRHLVESFFWAFARSHFIAFVDASPEEREGLWSQFRRRANRNATGLDIADLNAEARCIYFDDPGACVAGDVGRGGIVFADAVGQARGLEGLELEEWTRRLGAAFEIVRCASPAHPAGLRRERTLAVRYFRWLPWDMGLWTGADDHEVASEVWVLANSGIDQRWSEAVRSAFPDLELRVFADGGADAVAGALPLRALSQKVFGQRLAPTMVVRLSDDRGFDVFVEWCAANGVPLRDFVAYADASSARGGAPTLTRLSGFFRPGQPSSNAQSPVSSWSASGWESLAQLVLAAPARRAAPALAPEAIPL